MKEIRYKRSMNFNFHFLPGYISIKNLTARCARRDASEPLLGHVVGNFRYVKLAHAKMQQCVRFFLLQHLLKLAHTKMQRLHNFIPCQEPG